MVGAQVHKSVHKSVQKFLQKSVPKFVQKIVQKSTEVSGGFDFRLTPCSTNYDYANLTLDIF